MAGCLSDTLTRDFTSRGDEEEVSILFLLALSTPNGTTLLPIVTKRRESMI